MSYLLLAISCKFVLMTAKIIDRPYSVLFLFGILSSILGVSIWVLGLAGFQYWADPLSIHKTAMFGMFMFSFVEGFILTALPNFTGGRKINQFEYRMLLTLKGLQLSAFVLDNYKLMLIFLILDFAGLLSFLFIQYRQKKSNPPQSFIFVPIGLLYGFSYLILELFYGNTLPMNTALLLEFGFILNIVLGVGAKILPVILGRLPAMERSFQIEKKKPGVTEHLKKNMHYYFMALLNIAFMIQIFGSYFLGSLAVSILLFVSFYHKLKIFERPKNRTLLTLGIWIALWAIFLGTFLSSFEMFFVFGRHIYFIAGISLLTVMIASRVSLSHGGYSLHFESTSKGLVFVIGLGVASASLRFIPSVQSYISYEHALICAGVLWMSSNLLWLFMFGKKIYQPV